MRSPLLLQAAGIIQDQPYIGSPEESLIGSGSQSLSMPSHRSGLHHLPEHYILSPSHLLCRPKYRLGHNFLRRGDMGVETRNASSTSPSQSSSTPLPCLHFPSWQLPNIVCRAIGTAREHSHHETGAYSGRAFGLKIGKIFIRSPSQSLSSPSQSSTKVCRSSTKQRLRVSPSHTQIPACSGALPWSGVCSGNPSSVMPSQSLSRPSHRSSEPSMAANQKRRPGVRLGMQHPFPHAYPSPSLPPSRFVR